MYSAKKSIAGIFTLVVLVFGIGVWYKLKLSKPVAPLTIKIGYSAFPSPLLIASEKHYFSDEGITVSLQPMSNPNLIAEAVGKGDVGMAQVPYSVLFAYQNVAPDTFKILGQTIESEEYPYSFLMVKPAITSVVQLKGKKIVTRTGYNGKVQADAILAGLGLTESDVTLLQVDLPLLVPTFAKPDVDGFIDLEPMATIIRVKGLGHELENGLRAKYIVSPYPTAAMVINAKLLKDDPDLSKSILRAIDRAIEFQRANDSEARRIYQPFLAVEASVAAEMHLPKNEKLEEIDKAVVQKSIQFEVDHGILKQMPKFDDVYVRP